ncbi:putative transcription factor ZF-HD family [Helianthus annuus]|nr:putative transcription factor ZF-HD family [Helianthus annuus]
MQTSSPYNNNNNNHLIRESSSETVDHGLDPDRFPGTGASVTPISVGSKLLKSTVQVPRYRECLKNHAANMGGNITDGCGEFMPSGDDGTLEALKCAACNCHRNFHRIEYPTTSPSAGPFLQLPPPLPSPSPSPSFHHHHHHRTPPALSHHHPHHPHPNWASSINAPPVKMAFGGSLGGGGGIGGAESSSEELNFNTGTHINAPQYGVTKKRFRTKFTQDQKDKMLEFAEKVGWRIPREDDPEVQRFCADVGVKRKVLKVWMHNNKATSGKKQAQDSNDNIN